MIDELRFSVKELFQDSAGYLSSDWIFPNHFEPMIDIAKKLCNKYGGDKNICEIACLLHDTGLVYKRHASPDGHEQRSIEYAKIILKKNNATQELINSVIGCIRATDIHDKAHNTNEKIVRSADILSKYWTMHFIAKAHFYTDWDKYIRFLDKKINKSHKKICFKDERKEIEPIRAYYNMIIKQYKKYNKAKAN